MPYPKRISGIIDFEGNANGYRFIKLMTRKGVDGGLAPELCTLGGFIEISKRILNPKNQPKHIADKKFWFFSAKTLTPLRRWPLNWVGTKGTWDGGCRFLQTPNYLLSGSKRIDICYISIIDFEME